MKAAEKQAKDLPEYRNDSDYRLFAGLYVVPYFPVGSGQTYSRDDVKKCFRHNVDLLTDNGYDFGTWFFMPSEYGVDAVFNGYYRPGILFGLKEIH